MYPIPNTGAFTQGDINAILANIQAGNWTGNTYYVDPVNGLDYNNGTTPQAVPGQIGTGPVKTLAAGHTLLVSGNADTLVLMSNGLTSGTARVDAAFTWTVSGCRLIGVCAPTRFSQRSRIAPTGTTTAFANFFTVTGSGNLFQNIQWFHGFNAGVAASICMTVTGGRNVFQNCSIDGMGDATSAASSTSRSLVVGAGGENLFQNCSIGVDTVQRTTANASLGFVNGSARNVFENCLFPIDAGDITVLGITALTGGMDRFQLFNNCQFINVGNFLAGTLMTGLTLLGAAGGGPNGAIVFNPACCLVGVASWGYDATSKTQMEVTGPVASNVQGRGTNPA